MNGCETQIKCGNNKCEVDKSKGIDEFISCPQDCSGESTVSNICEQVGYKYKALVDKEECLTIVGSTWLKEDEICCIK